MRPSLRSDSLMRVSFAWWSPVTGMQVGWICVKQGLANAAPRLWARQRVVGAEQQLLARLAARVERARHLDAAERAVGEQAAVLPRERHALGHTLVDDGGADLRQPIDVRFAGAEVAALDRIVEQP